jgi:hypothetical protein
LAPYVTIIKNAILVGTISVAIIVIVIFIIIIIVGDSANMVLTEH